MGWEGCHSASRVANLQARADNLPELQLISTLVIYLFHFSWRRLLLWKVDRMALYRTKVPHLPKLHSPKLYPQISQVFPNLELATMPASGGTAKEHMGGPSEKMAIGMVSHQSCSSFELGVEPYLMQ